ncbi:ABC transporter substrate-binding protein [Mycobacterium ulcerans]
MGLVTIVAAAVLAGVLLTEHRGATLAPYQPQSMTGTLGTVELHHRPVAVAALGPGDADAVLSLGVQPVAIGGTHGQTPSWLAPMVKSSPAMLPTADPATLAETRPDLIIDTGSLDKATYNQLAAIAPTLTRPADTTQEWNWQNQLTWIATSLGRTTTATTLLNNAVAEQTQIKSDNPAFSGKTITVVNLSDTTTTVATKVSPPTAYLEGLGFAYNVYFKRGPNDPPEVEVDEDSFDWGRAKMTDVMIVIRTDRAAGGADSAVYQASSPCSTNRSLLSMTLPPLPRSTAADQQPPHTSTRHWSTNSPTRSTDPAVSPLLALVAMTSSDRFCDAIQESID